MRVAAILLLFIFGCSDANVSEQPNQDFLFHEYLIENFTNELNADDGYYLILGKKVCVSCEKSVFDSFRLIQKQLNPQKIILITDYTPIELDTLLVNEFRPNTLIDSLSNFEKFSFPRSYATIYKLENKKLVDYVFFSEKEDIINFINKQGLQAH